jgi:hypothetical protein
MNSLRKGVAAALVALVAAIAAASCGGDDSTGPDSTTDISGNWNATATYNNAQLQTTCTFSGSVSLSQSGSNFTGQVSGSVLACTGPGGTTSGNADGPITGGQINGNAISYNNGECTYAGTITGSPANRAEGDVDCDVSIGGTSYPFTGTWLISR